MKHRARGWHLAVLGLVAAVVSALAFRGFNFGSIGIWSDYWDYLQQARQLHAGHGFTSLYTYPLFLKISGSGPYFPNLWRPPLYPLFVAITFLATGGPSIWAPLALQIAGYLLAVAGTYILALEFVAPGWALLAGLVAALSPAVLGLGEPGLATVPYTAGLTFGFLLAVRADSRKRAFWAGVYFGLLILLRGEALTLLPAIIWMLWAGERGDRESRIWHFIGAGLIVILPWIIRMWVVTGRPFSSSSSLLFTNTRLFPAWQSTRGLDTLDHSALLWALSHPGVMAIKTFKNAYHFVYQALLMPVPALAPFVWAALGRITRVGRESAYCAALLIAIAVLVFLLSPLEYAARFLTPFIPAVIVVAVIVLARFREDLGQGLLVPVSRRPAAWVAIAVVLLSTLQLAEALTANRRAQEMAARPPAPAVFAEIGRAVDRTGWGLGDHPAYYAWFTGARYLTFPVMNDLGRVDRSAGKLRTVVLVGGRGEGGPDPTGIESTAALRDSLTRRGWSAREVGPFVVLEDSALAAAAATPGQRP